MKPTEFEIDDKWQRGVRDAVLVPGFYEKRYPGLFKFADKDLATQMRGIDTLVESDSGNGWETTIDEKIVRWRGFHYTAFAFETDSCTVEGRERDGWMRHGEAEYLLYCFQEASLDLFCHLIEFRPLKKWFWTDDNFKKFPTFGPLDTLNRSAGRVVPIVAVRRNVPCSAFVVKANGG